MIFYFLLFVASAILCIRMQSGRKISRPLSLLVAINLVLLTLYYFVNSLSGNGFDESVVYHLAVGLRGAGLLAFAPLILSVLTIITACLVLALYISGATFNSSRTRDNVFVSMVLGLSLSAALVLNPLVLSIKSQLPLLKAALFQRDSLDDEILKFGQSRVGSLISTELTIRSSSDGTVANLAGSKNIIWIYAESLERTYFDDQVFGDLLFNLTEQAEFARKYTAVRQPWGTGWTIGGIVGSQCGVPLVTLGAKNINSLTELPEFMPGTVCFGDLLSEIGYSVEFIGGASKEFAGKGNFLATHGFSKIQDRATLRDNYDDGSVERNEWGYYDDLLLSVVKHRATSLHAVERPFFLNALTLDTHSPHGFVSPTCRPKAELRHPTEVGSAIKCSDYLLADFVNWFRNSGLASDTILVISSDHLSMPNDLQSRLESVSSDRNLLFWMLGDGIEAGVVNKPASTFDIGATILASALPNTDVSIGLGRNIESEPSLYEHQFDNEDLATNIAGFQAIAWRHVGGSKSIYINAATNSFLMNGRAYSFPVLVELEDDKFSNLSWIEKAKKERYLNLIKSDGAYVWLDNCGWSTANHLQGSVSFCAHVVEHGKILDSVLLSNDAVTEVRVDQIKTVLSNGAQSQAGALPIQNIDYAISVSGPGVSGGILGPSDATGTRGINFFQKRGDIEAWSLVKNIDYCDESVDFSDLGENTYSPNRELLVVVKDTAHCGNAHKLKALAKSLGLVKMEALEFRQPYIGIIHAKNPKPSEFVGEVGGSTIVALP